MSFLLRRWAPFLRHRSAAALSSCCQSVALNPAPISCCSDQLGAPLLRRAMALFGWAPIALIRCCSLTDGFVWFLLQLSLLLWLDIGLGSSASTVSGSSVSNCLWFFCPLFLLLAGNRYSHLAHFSYMIGYKNAYLSLPLFFCSKYINCNIYFCVSLCSGAPCLARVHLALLGCALVSKGGCVLVHLAPFKSVGGIGKFLHLFILCSPY